MKYPGLCLNNYLPFMFIDQFVFAKIIEAPESK